MIEHRSTLTTNHELKFDKKRSRVKFCPCGKSNKDGKFVPYVGFENNGYCHSCGETFTPELSKSKQWKTPQVKAYNPKPVPVQSKPVSFIPGELLMASLKDHETNHFVQYLMNLFGAEITNELISKYFIGTSDHWSGATVFWQIDINGNVRAGKIMLFNPNSGKRIQEPYPHINWVHIVNKLPEFKLKQCLFFEHLLRDSTKPVAIVEAPKTAMVATPYLPQFTWLAAGSLNNLNAERCAVLKGRKVVLFPDLGGYDKWCSKAQELSNITTFVVSDLLERIATEEERKLGLDLADYLERFDFRKFIPRLQEQTGSVEMEERKESSPLDKVCLFNEEVYSKNETLSAIKKEKPQWDIEELKEVFSEITLPSDPIKLNQGCTITDLPKFIESHISTLEANNGNRIFQPYFDRLIKLQRLLSA